MSEYEVCAKATAPKNYVEYTVRLPLPAAGHEWDKREGQAEGSLCWSSRVVTFVQKRIKKYLDWDKIADGVLVVPEHLGRTIIYDSRRTESKLRLDTERWQAHMGGSCPLDPEAVMVEVLYRNGAGSIGGVPHVAENLEEDWVHNRNRPDLDIIAYKVAGLAPGYEYPK